LTALRTEQFQGQFKQNTAQNELWKNSCQKSPWISKKQYATLEKRRRRKENVDDIDHSEPITT